MRRPPNTAHATVKCGACGAMVAASLTNAPCPRLARFVESMTEFVVKINTGFEKVNASMALTAESINRLADAYGKAGVR